GPRDAGGLVLRQDRRPHGGEREPGHLVHVRGRLGAGRRGRAALRAEVPRRQAAGRRELGPPRPQGVLRRRGGGHRQPARRDAGRPAHPPRRAVRRGVRVDDAGRRLRVPGPDRGAAGSPDGHPGPRRRGEGVMARPTDMADAARRLSPPLGGSIPRSLLPLILGVIIAVLGQLLVPAVGDFYYTLFINIGINVILAVSLNIVNGLTGQISIGHAGFMLVGGYVAGVITYYGSYALWGSTKVIEVFLGPGEWLFVAGSVVGGLVAAACGYLVGLPSLRLRGDYLAIVTLGFGEIVRVLFQLTTPVLKGDDLAAASLGQKLTSLGGAQGFGAIPRYTTRFWVLVFVTLSLLVAIRLKRSTYGRAFLAIRENEIAAEAMGVNTTQTKVRAFVLSAFFAGIAGSLFAHQLATNLNPR